MLFCISSQQLNDMIIRSSEYIRISDCIKSIKKADSKAIKKSNNKKERDENQEIKKLIKRYQKSGD